MDTENTEKIIKDYLYEKSSREILSKKEHGLQNSNTLYKIAAAIAVLIVAVFSFNLLRSAEEDRNKIAMDFYEFPVINKSRSNVVNISEQYLSEINEGKYSLVLSKLTDQNLSEKDLLVKANLYYAMDSLKQAEQILMNTVWQDSFNQEDAYWLAFLIRFRSGESKLKLQELMDQLNSAHETKADELLRRLK